MSLRSLFLLVFGVIVVMFLGVNWSEVTRPTDLDLIFTQISAPLGLVLVGLLVLVSAIFVSLVAYQQATMLLESRRYAKELAAQRKLAESAESSRFTQLRTRLDQEVTRLTEAFKVNTEEMLARVDRAEIALRDRPVDLEIGRLVQAVEQHNRDLHARVDRLEMGLREGLTGVIPAPTTMRPASLPSSAADQGSPTLADTKASAADPLTPSANHNSSQFS